MSKNSVSVVLFLLGLGSQTQIHFVGSIGISELVTFIIAPFILISNYHLLKRDKFSVFVWISILTCVGCVISSIANHTHPILFLKGLALPYGILSAVVVFHRILRGNLGAFKWFLVGTAFSGVVCTFVFQPETFTVRGDTIVTGEAAVQAVKGYSLYWSSRISSFLRLPIVGWFLQTPLWYSVSASLITAIISLAFSEASGRSAALIALLSVVMLIMGGKSRRKIILLGKRFWFLCVTMIVMLFLTKQGYQYAATSGWLGEKAHQKYEQPTAMGKGVLPLLISGRAEFFSSLRACADKPIIGFGPRPIDSHGYYREFLEKYGNPDDYDQYVRSEIEAARRGYYSGEFMRSHSHITSFWLYFGIMGLLFWFYVLWLFFKWVTSFASAYPPWFGYIALSISAMAWDIFFSPMSTRIGEGAMIACILLVRAIHIGSVRLSIEDSIAIQKYDK